MKSLDIELLQGEVARISDWIRQADQKSAFLAVYYSSVVAFLISYEEVISEAVIDTSIQHSYSVILLLIIITILLSNGVYHLFQSIFPRLESVNTNESLFYFGNIAKMKYVDFSKRMSELTIAKSKKQMAEQIYTNSIIANSKMENIQVSTKRLLTVILLVITLYILA